MNLNPLTLLKRSQPIQTVQKAVRSYLPDFASPWDILTNSYSDTSIVTVYSASRIIASTIADTPIRHIIDDEPQTVQESEIQRLIENPNPYTTKFQLISNLTQDLVQRGNGFLWIDRSNQEDRLYYLPYSQVQIFITQDYTEPVYYQVTYFGQSYVFYPEEIIHVMNPLTSTLGQGYIGLSPIQEMRLLMDTSNSQKEFLKYYNENAAQISLVIETDKKLTQTSVETFQQSFKKRFSGSKKAGQIPLLHDGLKAKQLQRISPADADFLRTTEMTKQEIAEVFGVPPSILGIGEQKYSNAEQANIGFQNYTLSPIMTSIQEELTNKLISSLPGYYDHKIEFKPTPLKYASADEKSKALSLLRNTSIITANEARAYYDLPELESEAANELLDDLNTQPEPESNVQAPLTPEDSNSTVNDQLPMTDSRSEDNSLEQEIHKLKTAIGRLQAETKNLKNKDLRSNSYK